MVPRSFLKMFIHVNSGCFSQVGIKLYLLGFAILLDPLYSHNVGFNFRRHAHEPVESLCNLKINVDVIKLSGNN